MGVLAPPGWVCDAVGTNLAGPRINWATRDNDPLWVSMVVAGASACAQGAVHRVGEVSGYKKPEVLGVLACGTAPARPQAAPARPRARRAVQSYTFGASGWVLLGWTGLVLLCTAQNPARLVYGSAALVASLRGQQSHFATLPIN